jgi:DNA-binding response OmpR family regulator
VKVLLVDDDPAYRRLAALALEEHSIELVTVRTAGEAQRALRELGRFDLILLDQELPGTKGCEFLAQIRAHGLRTPVVLVSVREDVQEKIRALELGADDYVVKPCEFGELVARMRAVLRRTPREGLIRFGELEIDTRLRRVRSGTRPLSLTGREFDILRLLIEAAGRVVSKEEILRELWGVEGDAGSNSLEVHVSRLRQKLVTERGVSIETARGKGYRLEEWRAPDDAARGTPAPNLTAS